MSCLCFVNTRMHVVSDQLGKHKGTGQSRSVGSRRRLVTSRPLSPSSLAFCWIWLNSRTTELSFWGAWGGGYNFILRLEKGTQQRRQQTRPCQKLLSHALYSSVANTQTWAVFTGKQWQVSQSSEIVSTWTSELELLKNNQINRDW